MPDGIVLLDTDNTIIWGNGRLREWTGRETVVGANFYAVLGSPEILGPDFCPFHTALATGQAQQLDAPLRRQPLLPRARRAGVAKPDSPPQHLIVTVRDVTERNAAAAKAGRHPPGRRRAGRPDARRTVAHVGRRADRAAEVEHPALHQGPAATSTSSRFACSTPRPASSNRCWPWA